MKQFGNACKLRPGMFRFLSLVMLLCAIAAWMFSLSKRALAAAPAAQVQVNVDGAGPREVEDSTEQAIVRDYERAWQSLAGAREKNNAALLGTMFTGYAKDELTQAINDQKQSNVRLRYVDHGHKLQAVFYSQEGSVLQLRDTAKMELEVLDGETVVDRRDATINYLVLMTPAADHWQVRLLQAVPKF